MGSGGGGHLQPLGSLIASQLLSNDSLWPSASRDIFKRELISTPFMAAISMGESPLTISVICCGKTAHMHVTPIIFMLRKDPR